MENKKETFKEKMQRQMEEERQAQLKAYTDYYQLSDLNESDLIVLQRITNTLAGQKLGMLGEALLGRYSIGDSYLHTITEQNFMIIKQLSELNSKLSKLINKKDEAIE